METAIFCTSLAWWAFATAQTSSYLCGFADRDPYVDESDLLPTALLLASFERQTCNVCSSLRSFISRQHLAP